MSKNMPNTESLTRKKLTSRHKMGLFGVVTVAAAALISFLALQLFLKPMRVDPSGYQVVSLVSGQVYFGKLKNIGGDYLYLESPYVEQTVQSTEKNEDGSPKSPQTALFRVKDQVYGPEDMIAIKSDQVVFWQNLRADSKAVAAIKSKQ